MVIYGHVTNSMTLIIPQCETQRTEIWKTKDYWHHITNTNYVTKGKHVSGTIRFTDAYCCVLYVIYEY